MKNYWFLGFSILFGFSPLAQAQTTGNNPAQTPQVSPTASAAVPAAPSSTSPSNQAVTADIGEKSQEESGGKEEGDEKEKSFVPHWSGQLGINYSSQPSQLGQGQISKDLSLTGTYNITESGHYVSFGITGGQQRVEGADTNYGSLTLEGGLGLGFFLPSLSVNLQQGSSALSSIGSTLTLNFQIFEPLTAGLAFGGTLENHQGLNPITQDPNSLGTIDSADWNGSLVTNFTPWDFLSFSLAAEQQYDTTFQWQNLNNANNKTFNQVERIPSITLGSDLTFLKDFVLELSAQGGQEIYPAGTVYSPVLKKTVTFASPTTQNFTGYTMAVMYNFQ